MKYFIITLGFVIGIIIAFTLIVGWPWYWKKEPQVSMPPENIEPAATNLPELKMTVLLFDPPRAERLGAGDRGKTARALAGHPYAVRIDSVSGLAVFHPLTPPPKVMERHASRQAHNQTSFFSATPHRGVRRGTVVRN